MILVSLLVSTICLGGGRDVDAFKLVGSLVVFFWSLPIIVLMSVLHFAERRGGTYARWLIAMLGFSPLGIVIHADGHVADRRYVMQLVTAGLAWSLAWVVTSLLFPKREAPRLDHQSR